jgi:UDP-N-acetylglucosamine--N-acetylmuramyl-(pentapeptide) pyrophosphoryl-undecaprenol N-acetylglucosamine transferase
MILLTASGTGGHIYPAIAVAQALEGQSVYFMIDRGRVSQKILDQYKYPYIDFYFTRKGIICYLVSFVRALLFFKKHDVKKVLSFGGYVTVPVVLAAWLLRKNIVLFEQNTIPGRANRFLARFSNKVCIAFEESQTYFKRSTILGGNPVRKKYLTDSVMDEILAMPWKQGRRCLVFGGSQGAHYINCFIQSHYEWFEVQSTVLIHVMGNSAYQKLYGDEPMVVVEDESMQVKRVILPYILDMKCVYDWADCVISRAGATTVTELIEYQKKALLIPYPYAADNHQFYNASAYVRLGLGMMVRQVELTKTVLKEFFEYEISTDEMEHYVNKGWMTLLD